MPRLTIVDQLDARLVPDQRHAAIEADHDLRGWFEYNVPERARGDAAQIFRFRPHTAAGSDEFEILGVEPVGDRQVGIHQGTQALPFGRANQIGEALRIATRVDLP